MYISENSKGYWSNLNYDENSLLIHELKSSNPKNAIKKLFPELYEIIFSHKREAGLELWLSGDEICVDYGCMWGHYPYL